MGENRQGLEPVTLWLSNECIIRRACVHALIYLRKSIAFSKYNSARCVEAAPSGRDTPREPREGGPPPVVPLCVSTQRADSGEDGEVDGEWME